MVTGVKGIPLCLQVSSGLLTQIDISGLTEVVDYFQLLSTSCTTLALPGPPPGTTIGGPIMISDNPYLVQCDLWAWAEPFDLAGVFVVVHDNDETGWPGC